MNVELNNVSKDIEQAKFAESQKQTRLKEVEIGFSVIIWISSFFGYLYSPGPLNIIPVILLIIISFVLGILISGFIGSQPQLLWQLNVLMKKRESCQAEQDDFMYSYEKDQYENARTKLITYATGIGNRELAQELKS